MEETETVEYILEIGSNDPTATVEEIDGWTRQLRSDLEQLPEVSSAEFPPPTGKIKGHKGDAAAVSALAVAVLPALLPKIVDTVQSWLLRGSARTVKFKGRVMGSAVDFEGSSEDLQKLLASLPKEKKRK